MSSRSSPVSSATLPRPLQLVDGNVPSPRLTSPSSSTIDSPSRGSYPTPLSPATPSSSRRPASANPRRQSSISYFPSDHTRVLDLSSPNSLSSFPSSPVTVRRTNSLGVKSGQALIRGKGDRRSLGLENLSGDLAVGRPPLTLTEKHADLLSFIAQKEAKCLELRSQLAAHEAELDQLKRKWERIVSRGMDRAYSTPISTNSASKANGAVLGGIKEGVQEVGRLLASGLAPSSPATTSEALPGVAGVSRASMTLAMRATHLNTQSVSSVSTSKTSSSSTSGSSAQRLSQSSASSLSFIEDEEGSGEFNDDERDRQRKVVDSPVSSNVCVSPSSEMSFSKLRRRSREVPKSPLSTIDDIPEIKRHSSMKRASAGLPPASSIPGIGSLSMLGGVGTSVGKKWGEIQKGETFTKSQKRASLLLSDVSQSIFAALASPSTPYTPPNSAPPSSSQRPAAARHSSNKPSISVSSNPFLASLSPISSIPSPNSPSPLSSSLNTGSLLDDEPGEGGSGKGLGEILVPSAVPNVNTNAKTASEASAKKPLLDDDDDDWNW